MKRLCLILLPALLAHLSLADDGDTGTPPPAAVTPARHVAATSSVHDPRTSYTHLPVMSGRPVNDTPIIICTWSGCDVLTWHYPGASLTVSLTSVGEGGEAGPPEGTSPVPPPALPEDCWLLYDACALPVYEQWLTDSAALLGLDPWGSLPSADADVDGHGHDVEGNLHMHPFDSRSGLSMSPYWMLSESSPPAITVEFAGLSGHVYALEWSFDMSPGSWQTVQDPFLTPDEHESASDIGPNRYFIYAYVANLPPELHTATRYFLRMTSPVGFEEMAARAGSGGGAAAAQAFLIPPSDEHALPTASLQGAARLVGRFWNPSPGTPAAVTFNEQYVKTPTAPAYRPVTLPDDFDLNDPLRVFDVVFSALSPVVQVYPTENYYYWTLRIGERSIRGNINLSARNRDQGVLSFYYGEIVDVIVNGTARRYHLAGGRLFSAPSLTIRKDADNLLRYTVTRRGRTVNFDLHALRQAPYPAGILRNTERFVERTFDESGLQFLLAFQPADASRTTGTFVWLLDPGPWDQPFTAPAATDFAPVPGATHTFKHKRTGFIFSTDTPTVAAARRFVLIAVQEEHVARNTWFDGPGDQLADNFEGTEPIKSLLLQSLPALTAAGIDDFGYFTQSNGTERVGLYVYSGYRTDAEAAAFANSLRPVAVTDPDTNTLWSATINAVSPPVVAQPIRFAFADGGGVALPAGVTLTGAERNGNTGQLTIQTAELYETPLLPRVWMTKTQKGTVVSIDAPAAGNALIAGEYRTAPDAVIAAGPQGHPWRDGFTPGPTTVAVDEFGECWIANTGDNRTINGVEMGSVTRVGVVIGGKRCQSDGTPDPAGEYLQPPFAYMSPSVRDRDGDGLIRTANGQGRVLPWPGTADVSRLDGQVTQALDELITGYVRVHGRRVSALTLRGDGTLWAGGGLNRGFDIIDTLTARPVQNPQILLGGDAALFGSQDALWAMGRGRVSRYGFDPLKPDVPVFAETLSANLGPAAARAGALAMFRGGNSGGSLWLGSANPDITNEVSLHTVQPPAFTRLPLTDTAGALIQSGGVVSLTQLSGTALTPSAPVFATEHSFSMVPLPLVEPVAAGSWWMVRGPAGPVFRREVPRNADLPAPFNRGLAGVSQGQGRSVWFADFLGHRAIQSDATGVITQTLKLYTQGELAQAQADAIASGSTEPFHRLAGPWTLGDMTGMNRTRRGNSGVIVITRDSQRSGNRWTRISWTGTGLTPDTIRVRARAADSSLNFMAPLRDIPGGADLSPRGFTGRFLQIYIQLREPAAGAAPPALSIVSVQ